MLTKKLEDYNHYFGYASAPEGHESFTEYFKYDNPKQESIERYLKFKEHNSK